MCLVVFVVCVGEVEVEWVEVVVVLVVVCEVYVLFF